MKTVLIVEDEKMIRQGIRTMVQRSGVPVEVIMECGNGEAALDIVREHQVDVMFTDIRMPKMDGIQLVREIQKLDAKPQIVAVSGYDDFTYAVEMLRNGVREYILKPVERQKITEILKKMEEEFTKKREQEHADLMLGKNRIRMLLMAGLPEETERRMMQGNYETRFFPDGYRVCMAGSGFVVEDREDILFLGEMQGGNLCICAPRLLPVLQKNELWQECAGASGEHHGFGELKKAYEEALCARKRAFFTTESFFEVGGVPSANIPEGLRRESLKLMQEQAWTQRLH